MNSITKLIIVLGAEPTDCTKITAKYAKKIAAANSCKAEGLREAGKITWLNNNNPDAGFEAFTWTWERCAPEGETSFFPEGNKNPLTSGASSPNQDGGGGGSMRPPRGRGAVMPAVLTPVVMDPSMGPPSNRARLDARRSAEKCTIEKKHNEILYSLAVEKENELYAGGCDPYQENVSKRKQLLDNKKDDLKNKFLKNRDVIEGRKPCKTN
jgi:hypothetical protein